MIARQVYPVAPVASRPEFRLGGNTSNRRLLVYGAKRSRSEGVHLSAKRGVALCKILRASAHGGPSHHFAHPVTATRRADGSATRGWAG